jgi:GntR family transcriptional regulator
MDLSLDRASEIPLGIQLMWKLRTAIATGVLEPGARLPGIRELAEAAAVNVNTVRSVLGRLEDQGLLLSEHGRGTFVSTAVRPDETLLAARDAAIEQARLSGVDPQLLATALFISDAPAKSAPLPAERAERAQRRILRAEIADLERELARLDPLGSLDVRPAQAATPRLLSATELKDVRDGLAERVRELRREREEYRAEQLAAEQAEEQPRHEPSSRWRHAGVWTGGPTVQVSWTVP